MIQSRDDVIYKLSQKIRLNGEDPELVKITNVYLNEAEFHALSVTPAAIVSKSRWDATSDGVRFAVVEFKGRHSGLVLAEIELREDEARVRGPEYALAEVTNTNEYSGGWLAAASESDLRRILNRE